MSVRDPREYTIVGQTTVSVPSREHPKVPYHTLRLEDEFGVTHLRKTMRQYEVGQQITRPEPSLSMETVVLAKAGYDLGLSLGTLLQDIQREDVGADLRIVLLLSLTPRPVGSDFLAHVLAYLAEKGAVRTSITFVARLAVGQSIERFLQKIGFAEHIPSSQLTDLGAVSHETISYGDTLYDVPKPLVSADWLIHLSTVELSATTTNAPITTALAEIFPGGVGLRTQRALDLPPTSNKVLPRRLHLVDGRGECGLADNKPVLLAGRSTLALDRALCAIHRVNPNEAVRQAPLTVVGEELEAL